MALDFTNATSDRVDFGSGTSLDNLTAFTVCQWVYITSSTTNRRYWGKGRSIEKYLRIIDSTNAYLQGSVSRASGAGEFDGNTSVGLNAWKFVAFTYNEAGSGAANTVNGYIGDSTSLAESGYSYRATGSGATTADAADEFLCGNSPHASPSLAFPGRIAFICVINKYLSITEIKKIKNNIWVPHPDSVLFCNLGFNGTNSQRDWSGNGNHGTVTGATKANHVPLPQRLRRFYFIPAAVAAGRTTKNTDSHPLGIHTAMSWRLPTHL